MSRPARFAARFAAAGLVAALAGLLLGPPFAAAFRSLANFPLVAFGARWIRLVPGQPADAADTVVVLFEPAGKSLLAIHYPTLWWGYAPFAVFACLVFAAGGAAGPRRLAAGLAGVAAYCALRLALTAGFFALGEPALGLQASAALRFAVDLGYRILAYPQGLEYVAPAVIWYATARRRGA